MAGVGSRRVPTSVAYPYVIRDGRHPAEGHVQVRERVEKSAGAEEAAIFDVQSSILEDEEMLTSVDRLIHQNLAAEKAFEIVMLEWAQRFSRAKDE